MRYYVVGDDGNKYGPADVATLNSWISEGRLLPSTLLEEEGSGARIAASAVPGLNFPAAGAVPTQGAPSNPYAQPPGMGAPNSYNAGYGSTYAAPGGNTETVIAWIMGVLGLFCCGFFAIAGIILSVVAKNKGSRNAQAALIFNIVVLVVSLILAFVVLPSAMRNFGSSMQQTSVTTTG